VKLSNVLSFSLVVSLGVAAVVFAASSLYNLKSNQMTSPGTNIKIEVPVVMNMTANTENVLRSKTLKAVNIPQTRVVTLLDEVNANTVGKVMREISLLNVISNNPIYLLINSPGGSVLDGELLISAMESSRAPVHTVCVEICASMAAMIHQYGKQRYMYDRAILMFHDASLSTQGKFRQTRSLFNFLGRKLEKMNTHIAMRSNMTYAKFMDLTKDDLWIDGEDAVNTNLADSLIKVSVNPLEVDPDTSEEPPAPGEDKSNKKKVPSRDVWTYKFYY